MPPNPNLNITALFNKFTGREVPMTETSHTIMIGGKPFTIDEINLADPNDATLREMKKLADDNGLILRTWWPGTVGTCDYMTNRVNAHIEKSADGKYRVDNRFDIG